MAEMRKLTGGCHCGKVRYEVTTDLARVASCNCSICSKAGSLLTFVDRSQFTLLSGEDALTDYQFNRNVIHHLFCSSCGVKSFVRGTAPNGKEVVAVNARCLDGVDIDALTSRPSTARACRWSTEWLGVSSAEMLLFQERAYTIGRSMVRVALSFAKPLQVEALQSTPLMVPPVPEAGGLYQGRFDGKSL